MDRFSVVSQHHQAGTEVTRVHAYPCAMNRASWAMPFFGLTIDAKPQPRRFSRIS